MKGVHDEAKEKLDKCISGPLISTNRPRRAWTYGRRFMGYPLDVFWGASSPKKSLNPEANLPFGFKWIMGCLLEKLFGYCFLCFQKK